VNNAGYFPSRSIDDLDLATWRRTMATNLDSHFLSAKALLPAMRKKKWDRFDRSEAQCLKAVRDIGASARARLLAVLLRDVTTGFRRLGAITRQSP
jgi:NAD(P)-dependent dehydrogenase (short-subunit alcohol dehydrogenase family)